MNLTPVRFRQRQSWLEAKNKANCLRESRSQHMFQAMGKIVEIERNKASIRLARGSQELLDKSCPPADRVANDLDRFRHLLGMLLPILQPSAVAENDSEDVVKVMRDSAGQ